MSKPVRRFYSAVSLSLFLATISLIYPQQAVGCGPNETSTGIGCISNDPASLTNSILEIAIGLAGGVAFLLLVFGGFKMVFSQGNPEAIQGAREIITSAIVGLLIVVFSVFLLRVIGIDILGIPI